MSQVYVVFMIMLYLLSLSFFNMGWNNSDLVSFLALDVFVFAVILKVLLREVVAFAVACSQFYMFALVYLIRIFPK